MPLLPHQWCLAMTQRTSAPPANLPAGPIRSRLYWEWQTQAALNTVLQQIEKEQNTIIATDRQLYQNGITSSVEGVETDINASKTRQQLNDVAGKMKIIEARLSALTNNQTKSLKLKPVALPKVASQLPDELGYSLLARRADLQAAHWYVESSLSTGLRCQPAIGGFARVPPPVL